MKYVLFVFCICGSANIFYIVISNSHVSSRIIYALQTTSLKVSKERKEKRTDDWPKIKPDVRKLKEAHQHVEMEVDGVDKVEFSETGNFTFGINPRFVCKSVNKTSVDLIVVVISDIKNFLRRISIRNTWGSDAHESLPNVRLLFLVGKSLGASFQPQIEKESELFKDMIQANVKEVYENLANKSIAMLQWVSDYCSAAKFVLKSDDDMYMNLPNLLKELQTRKEPKFFLCYVFKGAPPIRDKNSKWYTSVEEYKYGNFPKYCSGTAYSFSANIAPDLYIASKTTKLLKMEDVYITGLLAEKLHIPLIHSNGFWFLKRRSTGCEYSTAISGHEVPVKEMYIIHAQLRDTAIDCETNVNNAISGDDNDMFQKWQQSDVT